MFTWRALPDVFRFGGRRVSVNADFYNALNGNVALGVNNTFGGATPWRQPQSILQARLFKVSTQIDF